jgi:hypothetical protein
MLADAWIGRNLARIVRALLLLQGLGFIFFILGAHGAFAPMPNPPTTTDFASFYAAGRLANAGTGALAYDTAAHRRAEEAAIAPGVDEKRFLNPPPFLLICAPLAHLPYLLAFVVFEGCTFVVWLLLATRIAGGGAQAAACLAAIPAVWWALGWGQNSFLTGSLMAAGTLLVRRRPLLAGLAFGALCIKPHFGVLIPVALVAGRHWRAILGAGIGVAILSAGSAGLFGTSTWRGFVNMAVHARQAVETGIQLSGHVDLGGAARLLGAAASVSWVLQACLSLAAAIVVAWAWSRTRGPDTRESSVAAANAALVAGTLAAMPFVLFYDLVMAGVAAAWLARAARASAWRPGEVTALALAFGLSLLAFPAAGLAHLAIGVFAAPIILIFSLARLWQPKSGVSAPPG